jgi:ER-bound oxygenase mpaB/B'/Rubber oxygenase, catalytic domain
MGPSPTPPAMPVATSPAIPSRYVNLDAARKVHGARVDELAPYLLRGDPLADAALAALIRLPPSLRSRTLDAALEHGKNESIVIPVEMQDLVRQIETVPDWVDWNKINQAGAVYRRCGMTAGMLLGCCGLPLTYASPCANKTLVFSGRLVHRASRRLSETARFVVASCRPDGMKPHNPGWKITVKVRINMHAQIRRRLMTSPSWNHPVWGAPVNQIDMISTNLRFSICLLDHMRSVGFRFTKEEGEAVMMLWRYSAYLLGIDPELLCATEDEGRRTSQLLDATEMPPDKDSVDLTRALMEMALPRILQPGRDFPPGKPPWVSRYFYGLSHGILGRRHSEALKYPPTLWRYTARLATGAAVSAFELFRLYVPGGGAVAERMGAEKVDRTIASNLAAQAAKFDIGDDHE